MKHLLTSILLLSFCSTATAQSSPPSGYNWVLNPATGYHYALTAPMTWTAAQSAAEAIGANLATISSAAENDWLVSEFENVVGTGQVLYIGFNDIAAEGVFEWVSGKPSIYSNWQAGQPSNSNGAEDCTYLILTQGTERGLWNDENVNDSREGIIEWSSQFGPQQVITTSTDGAHCVYATDLDSDGDLDVLTASSLDKKIAWHENLGSLNFGSQQVISTTAGAAWSVYTADLDGDGDADVLSAGSELAWYENQGGGQFGSEQLIAATGFMAYASDLDGDGDVDILSTSGLNDIVWYENLGGGQFGGEQVIGTLNQVFSIHIADIDGDGDMDVLGGDRWDDALASYENLGGGSFGLKNVISTLADDVWSIDTNDIDGDGDLDVLTASSVDNKIAWYENLGGLDFGSQQVITTSAVLASCVYASDIDGDGDADVLSASTADDKIAWYENLGGGIFGGQQVITTAADSAWFVYAADLDGDGDEDVLSASYNDDEIACYENLSVLDADFDGLSDFSELSYGTDPFDQDTDDDGLSDGEEVLTFSTDPLNVDTDSDGLQDGTEVGNDTWWPGDPSNGIGGTDTSINIPDADPSTTTDPLDDDTDNDGLMDGQEDVNQDGEFLGIELDPNNFDGDNDGLGDGLELGLTAPNGNDTDMTVFVADADPSTTTRATFRDTDGGGIHDGIEDSNRNGMIDAGEIDPRDASDDSLYMRISPMVEGGSVTFSYFGCEPGSIMALCYSLAGPGPTFFTNFTLDLSQPIGSRPPRQINSYGTAQLGPLPVPPNIIVGDQLWFQGVQVSLFGSASYFTTTNMIPVTVQ
jgi:hypothetical protein